MSLCQYIFWVTEESFAEMKIMFKFHVTDAFPLLVNTPPRTLFQSVSPSHTLSYVHDSSVTLVHPIAVKLYCT